MYRTVPSVYTVGVLQYTHGPRAVALHPKFHRLGESLMHCVPPSVNLLHLLIDLAAPKHEEECRIRERERERERERIL